MFSKLNSFKLNSFRSLSIQDVSVNFLELPSKSISKIVTFQNDSYPPLEHEGDIPKSDSAYSIDIPDSTTLWSCKPRPSNCDEVGYYSKDLKALLFYSPHIFQYYQFTHFALQLNAMNKNMKPPIQEELLTTF